MIHRGLLQSPDRDPCVDPGHLAGFMARLITYETDDSGKRDFFLKNSSRGGNVTCAHCGHHGFYIHVHRAPCREPRGTFLEPANV